MAAFDDEALAPMSVRDRARLLNAGQSERKTDPILRPRSEPPGDEPRPEATSRPNLKQFGAKSEEIIRATKSEVVDLAGKGKTGFLGATGSIKEFVSRPRSANANIAVSSPKEPALADDLIVEEANGTVSIRHQGEASSSESLTSIKPGFKWKLDFDRRTVERQLSEQFKSVKTTSKSAIDSMATASKPVRSGFDNVSKAVMKLITENMSDDLSDFMDRARGNPGICSKCKSFRFQEWQTESELEIVFRTPRERVLYHSNWCRLCGYLLRNLCRPDNDPFRHSQIYPYIQKDLKDMSFQDWVKRGRIKGPANWPFGHGKEKYEGHLHYLDATAVGQKHVESAAHLIPIMVKTAVAIHSHQKHTQQRSQNSPRTVQDTAVESLTQLSKELQKRRAAETAHGNLVHPLECFLTISVPTIKDPLHSGQVRVALHGYGRGFGAQLAKLAEFSLRMEARPSFGTPETPLRYGRLLDKGRIDLSSGAMWLLDCESNHGHRCSQQVWSTSVQPPPSLRVIDVQSLCVVSLQNLPELLKSDSNLPELRFVALSYVWGSPGVETLKLSSSNIVELSRKNGLLKYSNCISTTINDAIDVVKALGERYLWVDALCIVQDVDDDEKHHQIAAMDWLYSKALLTITAADGLNSMTGLQGVRENSRSIRQDCVEFAPDMRLLTPVQVPQDLDSTVWNSRAWTFQERLLSKRLLVFKSGQMTWQCRSTVAHEDMPATDTGAVYQALSWLTLEDKTLTKIDGSVMMFSDETFHLVRSETFKQYAMLLGQYTHRQMTDDGDILNAFGGLLQIFRQFFKFPMRYGLPEILFDVALLWQPTEKLSQRSTRENAKFPTWSWAGWKGQVRYEEPFDVGINENGSLRRDYLPDGERRRQLRQERTRPLVRWHFRHFRHKLNDEIRPLEQNWFRHPNVWEDNPRRMGQRPLHIYSD